MNWFAELDRQLEENLPDLRVEREEPMSRHTSFHIGGPAKRMAFPSSGEQMVLLLHIARACGARPLVIGNGTNLLVPDEGLNRLVIDTSVALRNMKWTGESGLSAEAGVSLSRLADFAQKQGLTGLEFAHGIPGTVGGALCMNAGAYDGEMRQVVETATVLQPETGIVTLTGAEMEFGYRRSVLTEHPHWVVLRAVLHLQPGDPAEIRAKMDDFMSRRKKSQPLEWPSAGSTFKRPVGNFAGTLIERCGLKGLTLGDAQVSEKHAGFLINRGNATFAEMTALIQQVQERVEQETGVHLEPEIKIIR